MERATAEKLVELARALEPVLGEISLLTNDLEEPEEREALRDGWGRTVMAVYENLIRPAIRQYPDLDPDFPKRGA